MNSVSNYFILAWSLIGNRWYNKVQLLVIELRNSVKKS